ncbi:MAG: hypothetical protein HYT87_09035 [Nitrospirae bacterium]|nr:hypothetical protein [Nitrospirota bacterium]
MRVILTVESLLDIPADMIVLPLFADERPLRGGTGWVDWHELGGLSRLASAGYLTGAYQDQILYAPLPFFKSRKMLLVGMGDRRDFTYFKVFKLYRSVMETLAKLSVRECVLGLPGKTGGDVDLPRFVDRMVNGLVDGAWQVETFLEHGVLTIAESGPVREEIYITLQHTRSELKEKVSMAVIRHDQRPKFGAPGAETGPDTLDAAI